MQQQINYFVICIRISMNVYEYVFKLKANEDDDMTIKKQKSNYTSVKSSFWYIETFKHTYLKGVQSQKPTLALAQDIHFSLDAWIVFMQFSHQK